MILEFTAPFIRELNQLGDALREEAVERIEQFRDPANHKMLKVHKLHGRLVGRYSFSVNYKYRIVFSYPSKGVARLHAIGDHDVYR